MSTKAEILNSDKFNNSFSKIRSDIAGHERKSWLLVGHIDNNPLLIDVIHSDTTNEASIKDMHSFLKDDQVMYCLVRLTTTFDMSTTVKFVYIHWIGENVPFAKKGRYGVVSGSIQEYFVPYHLLIETSSLEDIEENNIIKKLKESSGTANKVLEGSPKGRQERGFTASSKQKPGIRIEPRNVAPMGVKVCTSPELINAINEVRRDDCPITWVLAGFQNGDLKNPLDVIATGEGGIEELKEGFDDSLVQFALYRTSDTYDAIQTVKFVYIYWIGEKVKPLTKGKLSAFSGPIEQIFSPAHVTMSFSQKQDIQEHIIKDKVQSGSGSKMWTR